MCLSCALQARLAGLVYGASEPKWGAHGSVVDLNSLPGLNHRFGFVEGGVLAGDCARLMRGFFRARREGPAAKDGPAADGRGGPGRDAKEGS
jgi:tRNA(adenine34) deaminase